MNIYLSCVIPVYNEKENLALLAQKILSVLPSLKKTWELILVDDGSNDGSSQVITRLEKENKYIKGIYLTKNFGQTAALAAGIDHALGEIVVTLDADLQNDPADIPKLINTLEEKKVDLVSGWRKNRQDPPLRSFFSKVANILISKITNTKLHDIGCTLKAYRKKALANINLYGEMHRFIPALINMEGYKITEIEVLHHPRKFGQSKYGIMRTVKVILDLITVKFLTSWQTKPIYMFGGSGLFLLFLGFLVSIFIFIRHVFFKGVWVSPMLFIAILLVIVGIQFILMGLIAEIQIRTWYESSGKKGYIIKKASK